MIPPRKQLSYDEFVSAKVKRAMPIGFDPVLPINKKLFDWQKKIVRHGLRLGRCAFFEECGLGKAAQQMEWAKQVCAKTKGDVLILAPIGVANQTCEIEAPKFGYAVNRCKSNEDWKSGINITNYERLHLFEDRKLAGVALDESSILKSFEGKTKQYLVDRFAHTPFRSCFTATPSPNDFTELGNHAEFLGICTRAQMLATYFINDSYDTGTWRLKKHAVHEFWKWVSSWAICLSKPSDIGFSDEGFELPPLTITPVWVDTNESNQIPNGELFRVADTSAMAINKEMRLSISERVAAVADITNNKCNGEQVAIWCNLNDEQDAIETELGDQCVSVRGADTEENKICREKSWRLGEVPDMVSKGSIFGFGMNWQHCWNLIIFPTYSHEDFYQIIRRFYRFGQKNPVRCFVVLPRTAHAIIKSLDRKSKQHETMREMMRYTKESLEETTKLVTMNIAIRKKKGEHWTLYNGDCVRVCKTLESDSIGFSIFSPPFADLFTYSDDVQDMGNCSGLPDFMKQFGYLIDELQRIVMPGREVAVHCNDLLATKWKDGDIEFKDFSGEISRAFRQRGFLFHSRITIWKSPVVEMQRTKAHGLLYKTLRQDSSNSRIGSAEYLLVFRKRGANPKPITHTPDDFPLFLWQEIASPVWMTVDQGKVLNGECARDQADERHICPLQLDVINRALTLWSAPDDLVLSPFSGIGSEGFCAVKMGRRFIGAELKKSYFDQACVNLETAEEEKKHTTMTVGDHIHQSINKLNHCIHCGIPMNEQQQIETLRRDLAVAHCQLTVLAAALKEFKPFAETVRQLIAQPRFERNKHGNWTPADGTISVKTGKPTTSLCSRSMSNLPPPRAQVEFAKRLPQDRAVWSKDLAQKRSLWAKCEKCKGQVLIAYGYVAQDMIQAKKEEILKAIGWKTQPKVLCLACQKVIPKRKV